jgi:hypothetical protein
MNTTTTWDFSKEFVQNVGAKDLFRERFQRALNACVSRGFSVEESFGMIWVETWEEISLSEQEQAELFDELLQWAKGSLAEGALRSFTVDEPTRIHATF